MIPRVQRWQREREELLKAPGPLTHPTAALALRAVCRDGPDVAELGVAPQMVDAVENVGGMLRACALCRHRWQLQLADSPKVCVHKVGCQPAGIRDRGLDATG